MGKHELNPEQKYRKQKKKQAYENKERERQKTRKVMSKKLDKDKIQARIDAIEKEEAAGRMTIGMRQEKTNLTMQLKSISKKSPQNNNAFKKRIPINDPNSLKNEQFNKSHDTPPPPPPVVEEPVTTTHAPPPPPVNVPVYNPMAKRSTPLQLSGIEMDPSLIPKVAKKQVPPPPPPIANPLAASLPNQSIQNEEEEVNVPGPKLRFSLFSYAEEESDKESKTENDEEFAKFMQDIANLLLDCDNKQMILKLPKYK